MKRPIKKLGAVVAAAILTLFCFTACYNVNDEDDEGSISFSVWLENSDQGYWDYYLLEESGWNVNGGVINGGYWQKGHLTSRCDVRSSGEGCAAKFKIVGRNLKITLFDGHAFRNESTIDVYGRNSSTKEYKKIGCVSVRNNNGKYEFKYTANTSPSKPETLMMAQEAFGLYLASIVQEALTSKLATA